MKPHLQPWLTLQCTAVVWQCNRFFHQQRCNKSSDNLNQYSAARRNSLHVRDSKAKKKHGSKDFWKIYNSAMNRNNTFISIPYSNDTKKPVKIANRFFKTLILQMVVWLHHLYLTHSENSYFLSNYWEMINKDIAHLDGSISNGPDDISVGV